MKAKDLTQEIILAAAEDRAAVIRVARKARTDLIEMVDTLLDLNTMADGDAAFFAGLAADCVETAGSHLLRAISAAKGQIKGAE